MDFKDDPDRVTRVTVLSIFTFIALVAVIFRSWARKIQRNPWDLSDYLIVAGLVWALGLSLFTIFSTAYVQLGRDVTQEGMPKAIHNLVVLQKKFLLVGQITWSVSVFFIRASVLALYMRIFRTKSFRITGYIVHGVNAAFLTSTVLAVCLICRPLAFSWDPSIRGGTCGDQKSLDLYIGILNLFVDITVVVLPMPVLWGLQMAVSRKLVLSGMFGLGIIICILTLIRIKISSDNHGDNAQKVYGMVALFTNLEALLGITNACLPIMKPIFIKLYSSMASSWLSNVMSGSIPIFMRPSQMGSAWKPNQSRQTSTYKPPPSNEKSPWRWSKRTDVATPPETQRSPPPRYVDSTSNPNTHPALKSSRPPVPPKSGTYSAPRRWEQENEKAPDAIYVEKSWDVERGSADSDEQALVRDSQNWI